MKITKTKLKQIIKEELNGAIAQKVYLVTVGYRSTAVGIFSSMEAAEEGMLRDIEGLTQEGELAEREDYDIDEYILDKGRTR